MQLFLHSEDLSDENSKMSIVEVPEAVSEKLKTNDIDKTPDNNYEFRSNAKNEILDDVTSKNDNCVDNNDLEKLERSNIVPEINVCNGKVDINIDQKVSKQIENTSEINYSSKEHEKLNNDKENDYETEVTDSIISVNNSKETIVTKTIEDSNFDSHISESNESTSSKIADNLINRPENTVSDETFSKETNQNHSCDKFPTENGIVTLTQHEEKNLSTLLEQTVPNKTENDLIETGSEKIESIAHNNVENMGIVKETIIHLDNSTVTGNALPEIKTEHEAEVGEQDVEMSSAEDKSNEILEHNIEIKKESHPFDTEGDSNNENSSVISSDLEKSLENSKSVLVSVSIKAESEDVVNDAQIRQLKSEKDLSDTEINEELEEKYNETINSDLVSLNIPVEKVLDVQPDQKTAEKRNAEVSNSVKSSEINNEGYIMTAEITETNNTDDIVLSVDNEECIQSTNRNKENQAVSNVIENPKESPKLNTNANSDISNVTKLPDVVHEILELNEEKHLSKELKELPDQTLVAQTLDILSDSDDESHKSNIVNTSEKQCISLVDDDDIMLVDDDSMSRDQLVNEVDVCNTISENTAENVQELKAEELESDEKIIDDSRDDITTTVDKLTSSTIQVDAIKVEEKSDEIKLLPESEKPLVPIDFMKYCKPILSEMTRDHLEEFCLQRIVEGIVDRSNFSEVKTKLKVMSQNCEEWRKKAMMLSKQNRDLQIVLKTVQEEQKKKSAEVIAPLRITRSVGMQVYMVEPNRNDANATRARRAPPTNRWRGVAPATGTGTGAGVGHGVGRGTSGTGIRGSLSPAIPVPRLVPAPGANTNSPTKTARTPPPTGVSVSSPSSQPQLQSAAVSSNTGRTVPTPASAAAGSTSPAQVQPQARSAEKRPLNGSGGAQSVTVDLTDDEPPAKRPARAVGSLRVVPQQQLVAPPRASAPRKVYIPISGTQTQTIRPGQTIMFKNVVPPSQRARNPGGLWMGGAGTGNMVRLAPRTGPRHPAPLPEAPKQAQPPNWKTLPPAPDLKISKVENGIVISWKIDGYQEDTWEEIASYQLYAYQETSTAPSTMLWKKIGDVKALPLPMACTLTQFMAGYKYYFAVRAVDIRSRIGPFSLPGSILLLNK